MSALFTCEIFRLFVNTMNPEDKYSGRYMQIFSQQLQRPLSQKGMVVFRFFIAFLKCAWNYKILKRKKSNLAYLLPKLLHPKEMFT